MPWQTDQAVAYQDGVAPMALREKQVQFGDVLTMPEACGQTSVLALSSVLALLHMS